MDLKTRTDQLIAAALQDIELRESLIKSGELNAEGYNPEMQRCHEQNADLLEAFIQDFGWPTPNLCGEEAHNAATLIALHAISKPSLQRLVLKQLEKSVHDDPAFTQAYTSLYDRIALYEGRPQLYGTQYFPSKNGWYLRDLDSLESVNYARANVGLPALTNEDIHLESADLEGTIENEDHWESEFVDWCKRTGWR